MPPQRRGLAHRNCRALTVHAVGASTPRNSAGPAGERLSWPARPPLLTTRPGGASNNGRAARGRPRLLSPLRPPTPPRRRLGPGSRQRPSTIRTDRSIGNRITAGDQAHEARAGKASSATANTSRSRRATTRSQAATRRRWRSFGAQRTLAHDTNRRGEPASLPMCVHWAGEGALRSPFLPPGRRAASRDSPAIGSGDDCDAELAARLRSAPPDGQLGRETVNALTFKLD